MLDELIRIPFTRVRFGLDAVLGLVPIVGDFAGLALGLPVLVAGLRRRLGAAVLLVMALNVLLDAVVGSVPLLGSLFDVAWRAHRKNLTLLRDPAALPLVVREARLKMGGLAGIVACLAVLLIGLMAMAIVLAVRFLAWDWTAGVPLPQSA